MTKKEYQFSYSAYPTDADLTAADRDLVLTARKLTQSAYAPYSRFRVAAVARLVNGMQLEGTNQENASYPVGICAERTVLAMAGSQFPGTGIDTLAIAYDNARNESAYPISPCGMCRQFLQEFESRTGHPIRLILSGQAGPIFIIDQSNQLLPLAFTGRELNDQTY